jgi:hypothetical protein
MRILLFGEFLEVRRGVAVKKGRRPTLKLLEGDTADRLRDSGQSGRGPSAPDEQQLPSAFLPPYFE